MASEGAWLNVLERTPSWPWTACIWIHLHERKLNIYLSLKPPICGVSCRLQTNWILTYTHTSVFCGVASGKSADGGGSEGEKCFLCSQTLISSNLVRSLGVSRESEVVRQWEAATGLLQKRPWWADWRLHAQLSSNSKVRDNPKVFGPVCRKPLCLWFIHLVVKSP